MSATLRGVASRAARLDVAIVDTFPELSRSAAARLIREGRVSVGGAVVDRPAANVTEGALLQVDVPPPLPSTAVAQPLPLRIVFQDDDLAVIEENDGRLSYWALRHAPGKPDFHHPEAFALELPA